MIMMTTTGISATPCSTIIDAGDGNRVTKQEARFRTEVSTISHEGPLRDKIRFARSAMNFLARSVALRSR